jgi:hypothetical protein
MAGKRKRSRAKLPDLKIAEHRDKFRSNSRIISHCNTFFNEPRRSMPDLADAAVHYKSFAFFLSRHLYLFIRIQR